MMLTSAPELAERAARLRNMAHSPKRRFLHDIIGFNYRLTNLQAAIGVAQLERVAESVSRKLQMAATYKALLADIEGLKLPVEEPYARSVYWMFTLLVNEHSLLTRDELMAGLKELGVETRLLSPT
jgi:perosamine synthetase